MTILLLIGVFLVSLVLTMVGLGGGLVFSPMLLLLGLPKSAAAATSLLLNLVGAGAAAITFAQKKMVDYRLAVPLLVSSSATAPLGSYLNLRLNLQPFLLLMAAILALAAVRMLLPPPVADSAALPATRKIYLGLALGAGIGLIGGLLGIGGGILIVPLLIYLLHTPTKTAAATTTFIVCFSSLTGFLGYAGLQRLDWALLLPAAVAAFAGGQLGARLMSTKLQGKTIRRLFAVILIVLCGKLLHQAFFL